MGNPRPEYSADGEYIGTQYPEGSYPNDYSGANQPGYSDYPTQNDQYADSQQSDSYVNEKQNDYPASGYADYDNKDGETTQAQADSYETEGGYSVEPQYYPEEATYTRNESRH